MDPKVLLFVILGNGKTEGNEAKIVEGLLACDSDYLNYIAKYVPNFAKIVASVWKNKEVINHLSQHCKIPLRVMIAILGEVKFTPIEEREMLNVILGRIEPKEYGLIENLYSIDLFLKTVSIEE